MRNYERCVRENGSSAHRSGSAPANGIRGNSNSTSNGGLFGDRERQAAFDASLVTGRVSWRSAQGSRRSKGSTASASDANPNARPQDPNPKPRDVWLVASHPDELTVNVPFLAVQHNINGVFILPCCLYDFDGAAWPNARNCTD